MSSHNSSHDRVYWHSRRGMLELDLALMPFAREVYPQLPEREQEIYRNLLACEDTELFDWLLQKSRPEDKDLAAIMEKIITYAKTATD
jgi:antitoxin CptB